MQHRSHWVMASMAICAGLFCVQPSLAGFGDLAGGLPDRRSPPALAPRN